MTTHWHRREPGGAVKHWVKSNAIKMYDKAGAVLRIETVINDPTEFFVHRPREVISQKPGGNRSLRKPGMMLCFGHGTEARYADGLRHRDSAGATDSAGGSALLARH